MILEKSCLPPWHTEDLDFRNRDCERVMGFVLSPEFADYWLANPGQAGLDRIDYDDPYFLECCKWLHDRALRELS